MPTTPGGFPYSTNPEDYDRLIQLYDTDGLTLISTLNSISGGQNEVAAASFQWLRLGGMGSGSMTLNRSFDATRLVAGQWVKMSYKEGTPWYYGRIESWDATCPVGVTVSLYGPMAVLTEVQAGGQGSWDTRPPHTYAKGDYFVHDPDHSVQSFDSVQDHDALIRLIYSQYIGPYAGGLFPLGPIVLPTAALDFTSITFRGEESISQILRGLSDACYGASYGFDANRNFFFIQKDSTTDVLYQEGQHIQELGCAEDRSLMYNRMILVGGYVYGANTQAGFFRWVSTHFDTPSLNTFGAKQVRIYLPWVRTISEANNFALGFFQKYAGPTTRYTATTTKQGGALFPWLNHISLEPRTGATWGGTASVTSHVDQVDVAFNEAPQFTFTLGPEALQYPIEPEPQRWEIGTPGEGGDLENVSDLYSYNFSFSSSGGSGSVASDAPSAGASNYPSSNVLSDGASNYPSEGASDFPSTGASNYPSRGASDYPSSNVASNNASNAPSAGESGLPSAGESALPSSNVLSDGASNYPSEGASDFPSVGASNYPSQGASDYPSSNAPSDLEPPPNGGCEEFVCAVLQNGCIITTTKMTATEAGTKIANAAEFSPVLAARFAAAISPYL